MRQLSNISLAQIITEETYIISDTHFGDKDVVKHEPNRLIIAKARGFKTQDDCLIAEINKIHKQKGVVFHLGDFSKSKKNVEKYCQLIGHGRSILLKGNHDIFGKSSYIPAFNRVISEGVVSSDTKDFVSTDNQTLENFYIKDIMGIRIFFSHFPVFNDDSFDKQYKNTTEALQKIFLQMRCDINIHGHTHTKNSKDKRCINCSVDQTDMKPITIKKVIENAINDGIIKKEDITTIAV